jgi:nucleoid-associated protein YgaU
MNFKSMLGALAVACFVAGAAPRLHAQTMSTFTRAKQAASKAVAATNEHTSREQMLGSTGSAPEKPADNVATAPARGSSAAPAAAKAAAAPVHDATAKPSAPSRAPATAGAAGKGATKPGASSEKGPGKEITLVRESFTYNSEGRRDPFVSLIANGDLRPMISDLRLVTVIYSPEGRSVAIMRDVSTQEQYRVKAGQTLGRMRVARISPKSVTFTIDEYGFSRQEVLALNDTTRARSQ